MNTTLKQAVNLIATLQPVKGNSLYSQDTNKFYIVYSYGEHFPLAAYSHIDKLWYLNIDKYSMTTSRHQSIVKQALDNESILCTTDELQSLLKGIESCKL